MLTNTLCKALFVVPDVLLTISISLVLKAPELHSPGQYPFHSKAAIGSYENHGYQGVERSLNIRESRWHAGFQAELQN